MPPTCTGAATDAHVVSARATRNVVFCFGPSYNWKALVRSLGGSTASLAFTIFDQRTTVMEGSLFSPTANLFGLTGEALLELAVNHELGHCVCPDQNEWKADDYTKVGCGNGSSLNRVARFRAYLLRHPAPYRLTERGVPDGERIAVGLYHGCDRASCEIYALDL